MKHGFVTLDLNKRFRTSNGNSIALHLHLFARWCYPYFGILFFIMIDYLEKGPTINDQYYTLEVQLLNDTIKRKAASERTV